MKIIKELHVLVGLPGSGKTTFASQYRDTIIDKYGYKLPNYKTKKYADIIDFDKIYQKLKKDKIDKEKILKMIFYKFKYDIIILDGLFVNEKEVEWILDVLLTSEKFNENYKVEKIIIDYWIPDVESCLWNDCGRRELSSTLSIENIKIEKPNKKTIEEKYGIHTKLIEHYVYRKPEYKVMIDQYNLQSIKNEKYLESRSWFLGGMSYGWDGSSHTIGPEAPCNFDEFDELLEKICPTITFLQYKKLYSFCVTMEERDCSDYYSRASEAFYLCDLEKMYEKLEEMCINVLN